MKKFLCKILNIIKTLFGFKEAEMPQGLEVWDANGVPILSPDNRVMKILGGLYTQGNSRLVDVEYNFALNDGEFFWIMAGGSGTDYGRISVVRDTYINNVGNPIPRVTMRATDTHNTNNDTYFIRYGVY